MSQTAQEITQISTSLCIEATAGSGKTTLMVQRLRYLLVEKQISPDQILAITFTEKAAAEMKERLGIILSEIPTITNVHEIMDRIQVSTIHAFCHGILRKYALFIHQSPHFRVVDTIEKEVIVKRHIDGILNSFKDDPPEWLSLVLSQWSYDQVTQIIKKADSDRTIMDYWMSNGFFDIDEEGVDPLLKSETEKMGHNLKALFTEYYKRIDHDKRLNQWLDHEDILTKTYQLLANIDVVRYHYQSQIKHIFVDEFQDTSPIQWAIVQALCDDKDPIQSQKCWIVGDRCQSIYGFRGADDQLMAMLINTEHPDLSHEKNANNYRSHPEIVHFINGLFTRLFNDYDQEFLTMVPKKDGGGPASVGCHIVGSFNEECEIIKAVIDQYRLNNALSDIAILVRKRYDIKQLEQYLVKAGIPVFVYKGGGLCELDSVQVVICFLKGMLRLDDAIAWYGIARDILNLTDDQIFQLSKDKESLGITIKQADMGMIDDIQNRCHEWFDRLKGGILINQLNKLVFSLDLYCDGADSDREAISRFMVSFTDQWQQSNADQSHCLNWLDYCIENPRVMSQESTPTTDAVQIMTLHAAKGLEFPKIIVPFIHASFNFGASDPMIVSRACGIGLSMKGWSTKNTIRSRIFAKEKEQSILEELRLFYVTLTRAKQHIVLTGQELKRKNVSRLSMLLPYLKSCGATEHSFTFQYTQTGDQGGEIIESGDSNVVYESDRSSVIINNTHQSPTIYSVSNILDALECHKKMYLKQLRPLEIEATEDQKRGEVYHMIMGYLLMNASQRKDMVKMRCMDLFNYPDILTENDIINFINKIVDKEWFMRVTTSGQLKVETPFEYSYDQIVIRGRFDAIWLNKDRFSVLEFKSSLDHSMSRYIQQVHLYAQIIQAQNKELSFDLNASGLIDLRTGEWGSVSMLDNNIDQILAKLPTQLNEASPNPLACKVCEYDTKIKNCKQYPFQKY